MQINWWKCSSSVKTGNREPCRPWNHAAVLPQREAYPSPHISFKSTSTNHFFILIVLNFNYFLDCHFSEVNWNQVWLWRRRLRGVHGHGVALPTCHQNHQVSFKRDHMTLLLYLHTLQHLKDNNNVGPRHRMEEVKDAFTLCHRVRRVWEILQQQQLTETSPWWRHSCQRADFQIW